MTWGFIFREARTVGCMLLRISENGMLDASSIFYLSMFTLGSALLIASWQYRRVQKSIQRDERRNDNRRKSRRA